MKSNIFFCVLFFILSCNNPGKDVKNSGIQEENNRDKSPLECYLFATGKDTINLKLIHVGESITGTLVYKLYEKDKNQGTIQGGMRGNLLVADYRFMSEGIMSVRQVAFKKENNYFIEGYGDIIVRNDRAMFTNPDSLNFNDSRKLIKVDCR